MALRNQLDVSIQISKPFTEYPNIAFAPHTYTYSFTLDIDGFQPVVGYSQSLETAWHEASQMNATVLVTEFGGPSSEHDRLGNITKWQDSFITR